jgi:hypothetical protein
VPLYEVKVVQNGKPVFFTIRAENEKAARADAKTRVVGRNYVTSVRELDDQGGKTK